MMEVEFGTSDLIDEITIQYLLILDFWRKAFVRKARTGWLPGCGLAGGLAGQAGWPGWLAGGGGGDLFFFCRSKSLRTKSPDKPLPAPSNLWKACSPRTQRRG